MGLALPTTGADSETTFWHLGDAVRRTKTKTYLKLEENPNPLAAPTYDEDRFERLITWLYGNPKTRVAPLISSIRDIPDLNSCLGDRRSLKALEDGAPLREAMEELEAAGAKIADHLGRAKRSIQRAGSGLSEEIDAEGFGQIEAALNEVRDAVDQFDGSLGVRKRKSPSRNL